MDKRKRKMIEGWTDKAGSHLQAGREHIKSYYRYSDCIEACQECTELSTKAVLEILNIDYPAAHGWNKEQMAKIATQRHRSETASSSRGWQNSTLTSVSPSPDSCS